MKAARWHNARDIRVEDIPEPKVGSDDVKVRVSWCGICGSDLHEYTHGPWTIPVSGRPHPLTDEVAPITLGHEFAGVVVEVGENVTRVKSGDRVVVEPTLSCGTCKSCRTGKPHRCRVLGFIGLARSGGFAEYAVVPEKNVHVLPDALSLEDGALADPAAVALFAVKESTMQVGDACAVYGVGPIGLLTVQVLKAAGASRIFAVDISEPRLEKAQELGATDVICAKDADPAQVILRETDKEGVQVAYEAAGAPASFENALKSLGAGGQLMYIAGYAPPLEFVVGRMCRRQASITGFIGYDSVVFGETIALMAAGVIDAKKIVTQRIALDDIVPAGFETLVNDKSQCKILVSIQ